MVCDLQRRFIKNKKIFDKLGRQGNDNVKCNQLVRKDKLQWRV